MINGKFYVGMHQTQNLNDGYMGSGKLIQRAIKKYGIENFKKEILWLCESFEELKEFEKGCITEEFLKENKGKCYNLLIGGKGGFYYVNKEGLSVPIQFQSIDRSVVGKIGAKVKLHKFYNDPFFQQEYLRKLSINCKKYYETHVGNMSGKKQTKEAIENQKQIFKLIGHQQGKNNSQFGTCWITKLNENKKIKKELLNNYLQLGWIKGRNMEAD
jgi:hypothetical protein